MQDPEREALIAEKLALVETWVKNFVRKNPNLWDLYDDLLQEANLTLVQQVDDFLTGKIGHLDPYLRQCVCTSISDHLRKDSVIPVRSKNPPRFEPARPGSFPVDPANPIGETYEALSLIAKDWRDRAILTAKLNGCEKISDVAKVTGFSRTTIRKRMDQMRARYEKVTS